MGDLVDALGLTEWGSSNGPIFGGMNGKLNDIESNLDLGASRGEIEFEMCALNGRFSLCSRASFCLSLPLSKPPHPPSPPALHAEPLLSLLVLVRCQHCSSRHVWV